MDMEKYKDPRWQKKRLKILERDKWACQLCDGKEKTLHIHHKFMKQIKTRGTIRMKHILPYVKTATKQKKKI